MKKTSEQNNKTISKSLIEEYLEKEILARWRNGWFLCRK